MEDKANGDKANRILKIAEVLREMYGEDTDVV